MGLTSRPKWACNLPVQLQRGLPRPPVRITHMLAQLAAVAEVVGKRAHGAVVVTNGVGEDRERALVRTLAGTRRAPVGILVVVHGVERPTGTFEF